MAKKDLGPWTCNQCGLRLRVDGLKPQAQTRRWSECLCKSLGFIHFSCCMECQRFTSAVKDMSPDLWVLMGPTSERLREAAEVIRTSHSARSAASANWLSSSELIAFFAALKMSLLELELAASSAHRTQATWTASPCHTCARIVLGFCQCKGIRFFRCEHSCGVFFWNTRFQAKEARLSQHNSGAVEKRLFAFSADAECTNARSRLFLLMGQ